MVQSQENQVGQISTLQQQKQPGGPYVKQGEGQDKFPKAVCPQTSTCTLWHVHAPNPTHNLKIQNKIKTPWMYVTLTRVEDRNSKLEGNQRNCQKYHPEKQRNKKE